MPRSSYFVSTQTVGRKPFFRHERWARLMVSTMRHYAGRDYALHAFVVMPDHLHLLITPSAAIEGAVQLIKGGFSFRARREFNWNGEIWQQGFSDHRIRGGEDRSRCLDCIRMNPVRAGLVDDPALYKFLEILTSDSPRGLKPSELIDRDVRAEARTLHPSATLFREDAIFGQTANRSDCPEDPGMDAQSGAGG